jgi:DNA topoisomerase-2
MNAKNYKQLTQREHVLLRPETYIGTTNKIEESLFIVEDIKDINGSDIVRKTIKYSPAFIKVFDEALVNATDHYIRTGKVKNIKIEYNSDEKFISIYNDGPSIPIEKNASGKWIPEMIFFNFLSGSNFDDSEERYTGGRNGIGIKATATFSKKIIIEIANNKKLYTQIATNNLEIISEPTISKTNAVDYVMIKYYPDLEKFNMTEFEEDSMSLICKRVLESTVYCGKKVNISLNNLDIKLNVIDFFNKLCKGQKFYEKLDNEWEVFVAKSETDQFEHQSIVNGISTYNGGTHINWASMTISKELCELFPKKYKINWTEVKNNLFVFLVSKIPNPTFNSQSKDQLTNYIGKDILKNSELSKKFIKAIYNSEIVKSIIEKIELKEKLELSKLQKTKRVKVEKLVDSTLKNRSDCELFIYEGDSAGLPMRNYRRENQGFMCLRGKFINVSEMDSKKIIENKEAFGLMQAIGLKWGQKLVKEDLRYSKIIIATDADVDGDSITGQLLNFFSNWPELFDIGAIYRNITPLLIIEERKNKKEHFIYTYEQYDNFVNSAKDKNFQIHYKKGIGSLEPHQFKKIVTDPILHRYSLGDISKESLNIWFGKDAELRKNELLK